MLIKKMPTDGRKLLVIGTTSQGDVIESMGLSDVFNVSLHVPALRVDEVVRVIRSLEVFELRDIPEAVEALTSSAGKQVPIKKLLLWLEMAKQDVAAGQKISLARWKQVLADLS